MAITLTIELNDAEQAHIVNVAALVAPNAAPAQIKTWAEEQAKAGLRDAVQRALVDYNQRELERAWTNPTAWAEVPPPTETPPQ